MLLVKAFKAVASAMGEESPTGEKIDFNNFEKLFVSKLENLPKFQLQLKKIIEEKAQIKIEYVFELK